MGVEVTTALLGESRVGRTIGVSAHPNGTSVWLLGGERRDATFAADAQQSWRDVQVALTRGLPVLWECVSDHNQLPNLQHVDIWVEGAIAQRARAVAGPSFGLSLALLLASRLSNIPVPPSLAASAAVDTSGAVRGVDKLREKIRALLEIVPSVTTLVVAAEQMHEASSIAEGKIDVVGVRNVGEACACVFKERLASKLIQLGSTDADRDRIVKSLFRVALRGRGELLDWSPIERAATVALESWTNSSEEQSWTLEFVRGVAARHQRNAGSIGLLVDRPAGWTRALWLEVLAHLLQQAADSGEPKPAEIIRVVNDRMRLDPQNAVGQELHVIGAFARLESVTGRPEQAMSRQAALAQVHWNSYAWHELSRPLAEWLRLAGACNNPAEFDRAAELRKEAHAYKAVDQNGSLYVDLAWARAAVMLDASSDEVIELLRQLVQDCFAPDHVRRAAHRWLKRAGGPLDGLQSDAPAADPVQQLDDSDAEIAAVLMRLDEHVRTGERTPKNLIERLLALQPGVVGHLLAAAGSEDPGPYLARFYPY